MKNHKLKSNTNVKHERDSRLNKYGGFLKLGILGMLLLQATPGLAQGTNPTVSDTFQNTAGGSGALLSSFNKMSSNRNTAFGAYALYSNTTGQDNTASVVSHK